MKLFKILLSAVLVISTLLSINLSFTAASASFKDIPSSFRAYKEISHLAQEKIVHGDMSGNFNPYHYVTRAEAAAMIGRAIGISGTQRDTVFKDVTSSNFASGYIMSAYENEIISGYTDGNFKPNAHVTRAEMAILISRAFDYTTNHTTASAIEALKSRGIAQGLPNGDFGNSQSIIRADFAVFLARAVNENFRVASNPLNKITLVIDPGHGGTDPGAVAFGSYEKDIVLNTSLYLQQYLAKTPIKVAMTRTTDVKPSLDERVAFSQRVNGSAFVSIHANSASSSSANGTETFFYRAATNPFVEDSKLLATYIQKRLVVAMETRDRGVKNGNYKVIRDNTMPAVLVELGFINNKNEHAKLINPVYQQKAARAIYFGILDYYGAKGFNVSSYYNF